MVLKIVAQMSEEVNHVELCPDVPLMFVQWYWGVDMLTGLHQWFWVGPEVEDVSQLPNYISDEAPDTRQGVSYHLDRGL